MIDRIDPRTLTPAQKAQLILSEAQDEMRRNLWQAALGSDEDRDRGGTTAASPLTAQVGSAGGLSALLSALGLAGAPQAPASCGISPHNDPVAAIEPARDTGSQIASPSGATDGPLDNLGANGRYGSTLIAAGQRTGLPPAALAAIVDAEAARGHKGEWNPYSRNTRSSAAGLGQFLSGTWTSLAQQGGSWLNATARSKGWLDDKGHVRPAARSDLLALRYDPVASIESIADYSKTNLAVMRKNGLAIGSDATAIAEAAYLGHHLGPGDALRFARHDMPAARARTLLAAQVGESQAARRITEAGDAVSAHRRWLTSYISDKINPLRFTAPASAEIAG